MTTEDCLIQAIPETNLAAELGAMLLAAINAATMPLVARINELETKHDMLVSSFASLEDDVKNELENALDNLEVESTITTRRYR